MEYFQFDLVINAGGWAPADPSSEDVVDVSKWAASQEYPNTNPSIQIISARKQVNEIVF